VLERFRGMQSHSCEGGTRTVFASHATFSVEVECSCGERWVFLLFGELKQRKPEGYVEWLFEDDAARRRLVAFLNGVLVPRACKGL
jgi:hypothetical protein